MVGVEDFDSAVRQSAAKFPARQAAADECWPSLLRFDFGSRLDAVLIFSRLTRGRDMPIDRRTFIQRTALLAAIPTLAALYPLSSTAEAPLPPLLSPQATRTRDANPVVFKIDGWDHCAAKVSDGNEVLIRINQSWRASWR